MNELIITMLKIVIAMALGFFLYKIRIFNDAVNKGLSGLVVHVTAPCMLFYSIATMDGSEKANALRLLWIGFVVYAVLIGAALLCVKILKISRESSGVYQAALIFGNVAFLGLPLAEALFGPVGVFYMALLNIHFNIFAYTYGFLIIARNSENAFRFSPKKLINSGVISVLLAIIIFLVQLPMPDVVMEPIRFIGGVTSPLAMLVVGSSAAAFSLKVVFSNKKLYVLSAIKMLLLPIVTFFILRFTLGQSLMTNIITLYVGMPTAALVSMIAINFDADAKTASSASAMMNILCIVTIPILYLMMVYV